MFQNRRVGNVLGVIAFEIMLTGFLGSYSSDEGHARIKVNS